MSENLIDNIVFRKMLIGGAANLEKNKAVVDALNVFPVPDGDTGTNMNLTVQSAIVEIQKENENTIENLAKALAKGSLMGARGNSGVILSQLFRGFAKRLEGEREISIPVIAEAFKIAADTAYKAVMRPVEGTILTVARETAEYAIAICDEQTDMDNFLKLLIERAKESLDNTPNLLPILKEAGVVDAGGKGLVFILEGAYAAYNGVELEYEEPEVQVKDTAQEIEAFGSEDEITYMYCTEFMIRSEDKTYDEFLPYIVEMGDSIVCVGFDDIIKVHIHTNDPGKVLMRAVTFGELFNLKIENMKEQFRARKSDVEENVKEDMKKYGFVSIGFGDGIETLFNDLNIDVFISGGQTMNPSTEDILAAVAKINAENIFILPNNSNIILAAEQAKHLSDKNLIVIPSKTIPQGISAMLGFDETQTAEDNEENMIEMLSSVKTGQVTHAVRNTTMNDLEIKEGEYIGLFDKQIETHGDDLSTQVMELVKKMVDDESSIVTLFYGEDVNQEDAEELSEQIQEFAEFCDVEVVHGGQPIYYYIISVE